MRIVVDRDLCEGNGFCEQAAPDLFRLDDDGVLEAHEGDIPRGRESAAEGATRICPVGALRLERGADAS